MLAVILGTMVAVGAWASTASATIFWTNGDSPGFVHTANSNGASADPSPFPLSPGCTSAPRGIVSDGTHVYFGDYNANKIFIAGIDGSGLTALVMNGVNGTVLHPTGLAIDSSGTLYWANSDDGTIWELPHAGSVTPGPAAQLLAVPGSPVGSLHGLAVDGRYIYWADQNNNEIGRALLSNPSGTNVVTNFISGSTVNTPFGVTVDPGDTHIYWSNQVSDGSVGKAAIDGSGANIFISPGAGAIRGVAVDGGYVYYAFFSYAGGSIARSPLSGVGATQVVSDSGQYTSGLWASRPTVGAPSIGSQSTYAVGTTLTAYPNASDPSGTTYTYQWYDCDNGGNNCSPISNAGSGHYTIQSSDIGHDIKVSVTGVDSTGAEGAPRFSSPVGPVAGGSGSGGSGSGGNCANSTARTEVCSLAPIAYWRMSDAFDTSALTDSSGNGYNGEYKNGAHGTNCPSPFCEPVYGVAGDGGTAAIFTGNGTYAYVNNLHAPQQAYTIDLWFQAAGPPSGPQMLFEQGGAGSLWIGGDGQIHFRQSVNFPDWEIASTSSTFNPPANWWTGASGTGQVKNGYAVGMFHHVVATWTGHPCSASGHTYNTFLYAQDYVPGTGAVPAPGTSLDGNGLIAEGCSQEPVSGASTIYLGYGTQGTWFNGYLDEVAYYGHALSESTVTTITNDDPPFNKPRSAATKVGSPGGSVKPTAVIDKAKIDQKHHTARFTFKATSASGYQCTLVKKGKTQAKLSRTSPAAPRRKPTSTSSRASTRSRSAR